MARKKNKPGKALITMLKSLPVKEVAKITQKRVGALRTFKARNKIVKDQWKWTDKEDAFVLTNYNKGQMTIPEIGKSIGRTKWAVINRYRVLLKKRK